LSLEGDISARVIYDIKYRNWSVVIILANAMCACKNHKNL